MVALLEAHLRGDEAAIDNLIDATNEYDLVRGNGGFPGRGVRRGTARRRIERVAPPASDHVSWCQAVQRRERPRGVLLVHCAGRSEAIRPALPALGSATVIGGWRGVVGVAAAGASGRVTPRRCGASEVDRCGVC